MENLINLFINDHGIYAKTLQFEVVGLAVILIFFITVLFRKEYAYIVILVAFVLYISQSYIVIKNANNDDTNKMTMYKLNKLQDLVNDYYIYKSKQFNSTNALKNKQTPVTYSLDYMYIDSNLINFIYSISNLNEYNPQQFVLFIKGVNNILKIKAQIEEYYTKNNDYPENINEMFENAIYLKSNTLNNLHDFLYTVPKSNRIYRYISKIIEQYNILVTRNIDTLHSYYLHNLDLKNIDNSTKFINYTNPQHFDPFVNHSISTSKNTDTKQIPFIL